MSSDDKQREEYLAELFGATRIPFSGSRWDVGREDAIAVDMTKLYQFKSSFSNKITVDFTDLFALEVHAGTMTPVFVADYRNPVAITPTGKVTLDDQQYVVIPKSLWDKIKP